jgi:hypothetical protein
MRGCDFCRRHSTYQQAGLEVKFADGFRRRENFSKKVLANFYFGVEKKCSLKQRGQMSGNPVRIRGGCATVTATNSEATGNGKAE